MFDTVFGEYGIVVAIAVIMTALVALILAIRSSLKTKRFLEAMKGSDESSERPGPKTRLLISSRKKAAQIFDADAPPRVRVRARAKRRQAEREERRQLKKLVREMRRQEGGQIARQEGQAEGHHRDAQQ